MRNITYKNKQYEINPDESILSCFLRHGVNYPHSCQAGICQSCLIKSNAKVNEQWQDNIPATLKAQGYFLACLAKPEENITVELPSSADCDIPAKIFQIKPLNYNVVQLRLTVDDVAPWIPGQYLNLVNPDGVIRSYSIANIPHQDNYIELHIKIYEHGIMSTWLKEKAQSNQSIYIRGPIGKCFYFNPQNLSYDILLIGTGTGLSPLVGIAKDALLKKHNGKVILLQGGVKEEDLYYQQELQQLKESYPLFQFKQCCLYDQKGNQNLPIEKVALAWIENPKQLHVFVCGPEDTTRKIKTAIFCAGVPSAQILSDAFTMPIKR